MTKLLELARTGEVCVSWESSVMSVSDLLAREDLPGVAVLDNGDIKGVVTSSDLASSHPNRLLMDCPVTKVTPLKNGGHNLLEAWNLVRKEKKGVLPLVSEEGGVMGIVCLEDLSDYIMEHLGPKEETPSIEDQDEKQAQPEEASKFRSLYEDAPLAYQSLDKNGDFLNINKAWARLLGYEKEEVIGKNFGDFMTEESRQAYRTGFSCFLRDGEVRSVERDLVRKDGTVLTVSIEGRISYDEQGTPLRTHCIFHDVTESKKAREALLQSEETANALLNATTEKMFLIDPQYTVLAGNDSFAAGLGLRTEDIIGKNVLELLPESVREGRKAVCEEVKETGRPFLFTDERDGMILEHSVHPIYNGKGEVNKLAVYAQDVTFARHAEAALSERENFLSRILDASLNGVYVYDLVFGKNIYINPNYTRLTGHTKESLDAMTNEEFQGLFHPEDREAVAGHMERVASSSDGEILEVEYRFKTSEGAWIWCLSRDTVFERDKEGQVKQFVGTFLDITDKKLAELALLESERKYRLLAENASDIIWTTDMELNTTYISPAIERLSGYSTAEAAKVHPSEYMTPDSWKKASEVFSNMHEKVLQRPESAQEPVSVLLEYLHRDGHAVPVEVTARMLLDENDSPCGILGITRDISERLAAETAVRKSEYEKSLILNSTSELFVYYTPDLQIQWVNRAACASIDMDPADLAGRYCYEVWHNRNAPCPGCPVLKCKETGEPQEEEIGTPDGRLYQLRAYPVFDDHGAVKALIEYGQDITERKWAERALEESEKKLWNFISNSVDWVWQVDAEGRYVYVSPNVAGIIGYGPDEIIGRTPFDFMVSDEVERVSALYEQIVSKRERIIELEDRMVHKDGHHVWFETFGSPLFDENNGFTGYFGTCRDITDRKNAENALEKSAREWRKTFDAIPDSIMLLDDGFNITRINEAGARLLGTTPKEAIGRKCYQALHGTDYAPDFCPHLKTMEDGQAHVEEIYEENLQKDFIVSTDPVFDESGNMTGVVHVMHDITLRKEAEEEVREQRGFMEEVINSASEGIFVLDAEARYVLLNKAWGKIFGMDHVEYVGKRAGSTIPAEYHRVVAETFVSAYNGERSRCEFVSCKGESEVMIDMSLSPLSWGGRMHLLGIATDVTERKRAEEALKQSKAELSAILHNAPILMMLVDRERKILKINGHVYRIMNRDPEEMVGLRGGDALRCVHSFDHPDGCGYGPHCRDCTVRRTVMDTFETEKNHHRVEASLPLQFGDDFRERNFLISTTYLEVTGTEMVLVSIEDITELKNVERALRVRLSYEQALCSSSAALLGRESGDDPVYEVLVNLLEASGATRVYSFENVYDPEAGLCMRQTREVCAPGVETQWENHQLQKLPYDRNFKRWREKLESGRPIMGRVSSFPEEERDVLEPQNILSILVLPVFIEGEWKGFIGFDDTVRERSWDEDDIRLLETAIKMVEAYTERRRDKESIAESEKIFRLVFENVASGMIMTDGKGEVRMANNQALNLLGLEKEMVGLDLAASYPGLGPLLSRKYLGSQNRIKVQTPGGREVLLGFSNVEVDFAGGKGLITMFRDIGHIHQAEERRRRAEQLAQVGELAAKLSHEIKNPLASITAGLQLLESQVYLRSEDNMVLQTVLHEVKEVSHLVSRLLDAARSEVISPEFLQLNYLLYDTCELFYSLAKKKTIELNVSPSEEEITALLDKRAFSRVIGNLINNALDALEFGGKVRVSDRLLTSDEKEQVFQEFEGEVAAIEIADDGPGIPEDKIDSIFNPFFTTKESGTGLGLAVAREIVELHGGAMTAYSRQGEGTRFTIYIPAGERLMCHELEMCDSSECENCEIRECGKFAFCWTYKMEEARLEGLRYPEKCLECRIFQANNLTYYFGPGE